MAISAAASLGLLAVAAKGAAVAAPFVKGAIIEATPVAKEIAKKVITTSLQSFFPTSKENSDQSAESKGQAPSSVYKNTASPAA